MLSLSIMHTCSEETALGCFISLSRACNRQLFFLSQPTLRRRPGKCNGWAFGILSRLFLVEWEEAKRPLPTLAGQQFVLPNHFLKRLPVDNGKTCRVKTSIFYGKKHGWNTVDFSGGKASWAQEDIKLLVNQLADYIDLKFVKDSYSRWV